MNGLGWVVKLGVCEGWEGWKDLVCRVMARSGVDDQKFVARCRGFSRVFHGVLGGIRGLPDSSRVPNSGSDRTHVRPPRIFQTNTRSIETVPDNLAHFDPRTVPEMDAGPCPDG